MSDPALTGHPAEPNLMARLLQARELSLVVILVVLVAGTAILNPRFISAQNITDMALNVAIVGLLVIGQALVLLMRHVDLSVSSTVGLTAFLVGSLFAAHSGLPVPLAFLAGIVIGGVLGLVNGLLVAYGGVPALVATLGTLYVYRGIDYAVVHGGQINATNLPAAFLGFANGKLLGVPYLVLLVLVVIVGFAVYLRAYPGGREYYAVGSNVEAAKLAGINVNRRLLTGFALSGAIAGLAGVLFLARFGTVDASAGSGLELQVIAAAVVGGIAITGGVGTVAGGVIGAVLLSVIGSALVTLRAPSFWQQAIQGALLLIAISIDMLLARRAARALQERSHR